LKSTTPNSEAAPPQILQEQGAADTGRRQAIMAAESKASVGLRYINSMADQRSSPALLGADQANALINLAIRLTGS
jgi:hypothetical protein